MNKNQKIILAIFIPIIIFFIALIIAYYTGVTTHTTTASEKVTPIPGQRYTPIVLSTTIYTYTHDPFDWKKTWYVWFVFLIIVCIFEYKLFSDKKMFINKKKKDSLS